MRAADLPRAVPIQPVLDKVARSVASTASMAARGTLVRSGAAAGAALVALSAASAAASAVRRRTAAQ